MSGYRGNYTSFSQWLEGWLVYMQNWFCPRSWLVSGLTASSWAVLSVLLLKSTWGIVRSIHSWYFQDPDTLPHQLTCFTSAFAGATGSVLWSTWLLAHAGLPFNCFPTTSLCFPPQPFSKHWLGASRNFPTPNPGCWGNPGALSVTLSLCSLIPLFLFHRLDRVMLVTEIV